MDEYVAQLPNATLPLDHPAEFKLAKAIQRFSDVLLHVLETLQMHKLCDYLYNFSRQFTDFYNACYVVSRERGSTETVINYHRLVLCHMAAEIIKRCFKILGIRPLERM